MFPAAILLLLLGWDLSHAQTTAGPGLYRTLCYVEGWTHWRSEPVRFEPSDVDTSLCTHVAWNYAGLDPSGTHLIPSDSNDYGMWQMMARLKNNQPNLKVLLTVGGWNLGSDEFSKMSSNADSMQSFADNAIRTLRGYHFDGLIVDWDYPATRGDPPEDKHRLTQLLQVMYEAFAEDASQTGRPRLLLVSTVNPSPWQIGQSYELPDIANYVDWLDVKAFGLHGTWETTSGHHSALYSPTDDEQDSIHYMVQRMIANFSVPREKMTLGIAFYGVSENMTDPTDTDPGSPIVGGAAGGPLLHQTGLLAYFEICKVLRESPDAITAGRLPGTNSPYITSGTAWTAYDDAVSVQEKVQYVMTQGLGGVSVWTIDLDDFNGLCGDQKNPLLHAIQSQFGTIVG